MRMPKPYRLQTDTTANGLLNLFSRKVQRPGDGFETCQPLQVAVMMEIVMVELNLGAEPFWSDNDLLYLYQEEHDVSLMKSWQPYVVNNIQSIHVARVQNISMRNEEGLTLKEGKWNQQYRDINMSILLHPGDADTLCSLTFSRKKSYVYCPRTYGYKPWNCNTNIRLACFQHHHSILNLKSTPERGGEATLASRSRNWVCLRIVNQGGGVTTICSTVVDARTPRTW